MKIHYAKLLTEQANPRSRGLDRLSAEQIVTLMNREDQRVLSAVRRSRKTIARAAESIAASFRNGGRLFFVGAGTSGRLGVLEAAECPPTFSNRPDQVQAIMAGGPVAVFRSKEGAEDSDIEGRRAVRRRVRAGDVVVGIAASGVTPFVRAALQEARLRRAKTVLMTCNPPHPVPLPQGEGRRVRPFIDVVISLKVGPEIIAGSTRLKSGTACKMALNMLTTTAFVLSGKVYDHWMVDLQPKSQKLVARGRRLIQHLGRVSEEEAKRLFKKAGGRVKPALLMALKGIPYREALRTLDKTGGFLRRAIEI